MTIDKRIAENWLMAGLLIGLGSGLLLLGHDEVAYVLGALNVTEGLFVLWHSHRELTRRAAP